MSIRIITAGGCGVCVRHQLYRRSASVGRSEVVAGAAALMPPPLHTAPGTRAAPMFAAPSRSGTAPEHPSRLISASPCRP